MPTCQSSLGGMISRICHAATLLMRHMARPPLIQHSPENTEKFVFVVLAVALVTYARFVVLVVSDITNYLGIACLTVRKKDESGVWRSAVSEKRN
jgi:ethanolaminephosphotransferase